MANLKFDKEITALLGSAAPPIYTRFSVGL